MFYDHITIFDFVLNKLTFKAILCTVILRPRSTAALITRCVQFDDWFAGALCPTNLSNPLPSPYFPLKETVLVEYEQTARYNSSPLSLYHCTLSLGFHFVECAVLCKIKFP